MHWCNELLGLEWVLGGEFPEDGFDCWGLFRYVQCEHFNISVPKFEATDGYKHDAIKNFTNSSELENWHEVDRPQNGDGVLMRIARYPIHIGIWIESAGSIGILHSVEGSGVIFSPKINLEKGGWKVARFYRHNSNA